MRRRTRGIGTLLRLVDNINHAVSHAKGVKLAILGDHYLQGNTTGDDPLWELIDRHIDELQTLREYAEEMMRADE